MERDGYVFVCDVVAKFFNTIRVAGWFNHPDDHLESVKLIGADILHAVCRVGVDYAVDHLGPGRGFAIQCLRNTDAFNDSMAVEFVTRKGWRHQEKLLVLARDRDGLTADREIFPRFLAAVNGLENARVLDIGGRDRCGTDHTKLFNSATRTVFDLEKGDIVDVIGDAHQLSRFFRAEQFDAVMALATFEHLIMPWTAVTEINKVLKTGGLGFVHTHQTLAMHEMPWDFWRYSDTAWAALFNHHTGFEIIGTGLTEERFIIPFRYSPEHRDAERGAGFAGSSVMFKKIGPCSMSWPLSVKDVLETSYPDYDFRAGEKPKASGSTPTF